MIHIHLRQGIGLDIEYNEDIQHTLTDGTHDLEVEFIGIIIKIPFISIYLGDFYERN